MTNSNNNQASWPRIAVDAMGGDFAPREILLGALDGAKRYGVQLLLVGDQELLEAELKSIGSNVPVVVVPSQGKISEDEHPIQGLRRNPRASIAVATGLVKAGKAQALVSMGSTGAAMASATLGLGLFNGLDRPCVGGHFIGTAPTTAILDLGSNIDCRPHQLLSFAIMGCVFAKKLLGVEDPRVGLLSVGAEVGKGNRQVREAYAIFQESNLNFVGNVEGSDLVTDKANVVVCDGFVGNILLKFAEALGETLSHYLKERLSGEIPNDKLESLAQDVWHLTNRSRTMSGPLFGIKGNVIVGHGSSQAHEVSGAIETAKRCIEIDLVNSISKELAQLEMVVNH